MKPTTRGALALIVTLTALALLLAARAFYMVKEAAPWWI